MKPVNYDKITHREFSINSSFLEVPRNTYQRSYNPGKAEKIAAHFDERIANEPKVSCRDGHYYVFDGQHTIAARVIKNGGKELPIRCKVFYGLTEAEEALLFAQQTGLSARLTPGEMVRARIYAKDEEALAFLNATEAVGLHLDYAQARGDHRIACIGTAFREFKRVGAPIYKEALERIVEAWDGDPHSLRREVVQGMIRFVELYNGEYNPDRLVKQCRRIDPLTIYREGRAMSNSLGADKRYMYQVFCVYNGNSKKYALPLKF